MRGEGRLPFAPHFRALSVAHERARPDLVSCYLVIRLEVSHGSIAVNNDCDSRVCQECQSREAALRDVPSADRFGRPRLLCTMCLMAAFKWDVAIERAKRVAKAAARHPGRVPSHAPNQKAG